MRQDDDAPDDRGLRAGDVGAHPSGRPRRHPAAVVPAQHGARSSRATRSFRISPRPRTSPSAWRCGSCHRPTVREKVAAALRLVRLDELGTGCRGSSRAASSSGWPWPARWSSSPTRCCSTSRCPTSTPSCARRAGGDPPAPEGTRPHHGDGHPRPGRGAGHGRSIGGHVGGRHPADRQPARPVRAPRQPLRGRLRRADEFSSRAARRARGISERRRAGDPV